MVKCPAHHTHSHGVVVLFGREPKRVVSDNEVVLAVEGVSPKGPSTVFRLRMLLYLPLNFLWSQLIQSQLDKALCGWLLKHDNEKKLGQTTVHSYIEILKKFCWEKLKAKPYGIV